MRRENAPTQTTTCSMIICHVSESWGTVESQLVARRSDTEVTVGERPPSLSRTPRALSSCWSIRRKKNDGHIHCFQSMDTPTKFSSRIDVTAPPWISAFGSSLTLGPSVAPQLDHHSHGIQNNTSQQRTCHVHDHMSLSRPHVIFTTTCHFHKRQHVSPSNNNRLVS